MTPHPPLRRAKGRFEVRMQPQPQPQPLTAAAAADAADDRRGRMTLDKRYEGDLQASGSGEMLTAMTATPGSAAYVAIEFVSGSLHGRSGSFALQHAGTMNRGDRQLTIAIVPDSGSGALAGISGRCSIEVVDGQHLYELEYSLPD